MNRERMAEWLDNFIVEREDDIGIRDVIVLDAILRELRGDRDDACSCRWVEANDFDGPEDHAEAVARCWVHGDHEVGRQS